MRKSLLLISKRKWIIGGCLFFGGASLLTTGFATWIIGTQILSDKDQLSVTVDTAKNESISISATLSDNNLFLREQVTQDKNNPDQIIFTDNSIDADFEIKFSKIEIECGVEFYQRNYCTYDEQTGVYTPKTFSLSLNLDKTGAYLESLPSSQADKLEDLTKNIQVKTSNIKFADDHLKVDENGETVTSYDYIELATEKINLTSVDIDGKWVNEAGGFKTLTITDKTVKFKWGNFFSYTDDNGQVVNNGPAAFYNNLSKVKGPNWRTLSNLQKVEDEINAMNNSFKAVDNNKTGIIVLSLELPDVLDA